MLVPTRMQDWLVGVLPDGGLLARNVRHSVAVLRRKSNHRNNTLGRLRNLSELWIALRCTRKEALTLLAYCLVSHHVVCFCPQLRFS